MRTSVARSARESGGGGGIEGGVDEPAVVGEGDASRRSLLTAVAAAESLTLRSVYSGGRFDAGGPAWSLGEDDGDDGPDFLRDDGGRLVVV